MADQLLPFTAVVGICFYCRIDRAHSDCAGSASGEHLPRPIFLSGEVLGIVSLSTNKTATVSVAFFLHSHEQTGYGFNRGWR